MLLLVVLVLVVVVLLVIVVAAAVVVVVIVIVKGKAIPLQSWTGLEGSRRFRIPDFKTFDT